MKAFEALNVMDDVDDPAAPRVVLVPDFHESIGPDGVTLLEQTGKILDAEPLLQGFCLYASVRRIVGGLTMFALRTSLSGTEWYGITSHSFASVENEAQQYSFRLIVAFKLEIISK